MVLPVKQLHLVTFVYVHNTTLETCVTFVKKKNSAIDLLIIL